MFAIIVLEIFLELDGNRLSQPEALLESIRQDVENLHMRMSNNSQGSDQISLILLSEPPTRFLLHILKMPFSTFLIQTQFRTLFHIVLSSFVIKPIKQC